MSVIKVLRDLNGLFNYSTDENPTSQQDYQKAVKNWVKTIVSLVDSNLWQPETEYTVGSQLLTPSLPYYVLRCTVAGTSGTAEPDYTDVALGDEITDGTVTWVVDGYLPLSGGSITGDVDITGDLSVSGAIYSSDPASGENSGQVPTTAWVQKLLSKSGLPVGFEAFTTNPNLQDGWLPLLGGEYSRTTYADLWAWVQTQNGYLLEESAWQAKAAANGGNVPFYSKGDGSTTFRVPALKCWVRGANSISEVGGYLAAGLPNITGQLQLRNGDNVGFELNNINGAFSAADSTRVTSFVDSYDYKKPLFAPRLKFSAHDSSSIYGSSNTVQPESIVGMWVVKAYGTVVDSGSIEVREYIDEQITRKSAEMLIGSIQAFAGSTTPQGWLLCDGSAVSRTDYAALYAVIGTTYGAGNGSTTFNLPNLTDKFIQGSATAGTVKSAGLPNITGQFLDRMFDTYGGSIEIVTGAFGVIGTGPVGSGNATTKTASFGVTIDASRSSSIYGKSTTVQPPALTMRYIIKY